MKGTRLVWCLLLCAVALPVQAQVISLLELEVKLNPRLDRIAGTLRVHLQGGLSQEQWALPPGISVDKVLINERKVNIAQRPDGFSLPAMAASQGRPQRVEVVFYGTPPAGSAMFFMDDDRFPWIQLKDHALHSWHPWPPETWRYPDSVGTALILPEGIRPVTSGQLAQVSEWPGGDQRWLFRHAFTGLIPEINMGNYVRFTQLRHTPDGLAEWKFWVPQSRLEQAQVLYSQVPSMINVLAGAWGEPGLLPADRVWVETPMNQAKLTLLYQNTAPGYSRALIRQVAGLWLGRDQVSRHSATREAMYLYAEWAWVNQQFGEEAGSRLLLDARNNPNNWSFWLMHDLIGSNGAAWESRRHELFELLRSPEASESDLRNWIVDRMDQDRKMVFEQYLDTREMPLLECHLEKRRRKWVLSYRWVGSLPGFRWPVEVFFGDERVVLMPTAKSQELTWSRGQGKSYHIDEAQGLFEIRSR